MNTPGITYTSVLEVPTKMENKSIVDTSLFTKLVSQYIATCVANDIPDDEFHTIPVDKSTRIILRTLRYQITLDQYLSLWRSLIQIDRKIRNAIVCELMPIIFSDWEGVDERKRLFFFNCSREEYITTREQLDIVESL